jgi:hypothetical protein
MGVIGGGKLVRICSLASSARYVAHRACPFRLFLRILPVEVTGVRVNHHAIGRVFVVFDCRCINRKVYFHHACPWPSGRLFVFLTTSNAGCCTVITACSKDNFTPAAVADDLKVDLVDQPTVATGHLVATHDRLDPFVIFGDCVTHVDSVSWGEWLQGLLCNPFEAEWPTVVGERSDNERAFVWSPVNMQPVLLAVTFHAHRLQISEAVARFISFRDGIYVVDMLNRPVAPYARFIMLANRLPVASSFKKSIHFLILRVE